VTLVEGDEVEVKEAIWTEAEPAVQLHSGEIGTVAGETESSKLLECQDDQFHWISNEDCHKLRKVKDAAVDESVSASKDACEEGNVAAASAGNSAVQQEDAPTVAEIDLTPTVAEIDLTEPESIEEYFRKQAEAKFKSAVGDDWSEEQENKMQEENDKVKDKWSTSDPVVAQVAPEPRKDTVSRTQMIPEQEKLQRVNPGLTLTAATIVVRTNVLKFFDLLEDFAKWCDMEWGKQAKEEWQEWWKLGEKFKGMQEELEHEWENQQAKALRRRNRKISLDLLENEKDSIDSGTKP